MAQTIWKQGHKMPIWDAKDVLAYIDGVEVDIYSYSGDPFTSSYNQDRNTVDTNAKGQSIVLHNENTSGNITINVSRTADVYSKFVNSDDEKIAEHTLILKTPAETVKSDTAVLSKDSDITASLSEAPSAAWIFHCGSIGVTAD